MALDDARHPDAERLAEYADGVLEVEARADIERHLADCADCRAVVMETMVFLENSPATSASAPAPRVVPFRSRRWVTGVVAGLAAAAAIVLAVRIARPEWANGLFGPRSDRPELQELIAAVANEPTRPVEGRLSGGFKYAPPPSPTRGAGGRPPFSPASNDAIQQITSRHQSGSDPVSRAAFGVASLLAGHLDEAVAALEDAVRVQPKNAQFQSDLASAYIERARFGTHPQDLQNALKAAERATAQDPAYLEAFFNRALALERLERRDEALQAWEKYHRRDPKGPWSAEAVKHALSLMGVAGAGPESVFRPVTQLATQRAPVTSGRQAILVNAGRSSTDFPASYWASLNEHGCSATFIGPSVVLTAAHCVAFDHGPIWLVRGQLAGPPLTGRCDIARTHRTDSSGLLLDDWALCKMNDQSPVPAEVVNIDPAVVQKHTELIVTGYGCDITNGQATIGVSFEIGYMDVADPSLNGTGLIWATPLAGTTLCEGDSGGGTFTTLAGGRVAVAANSASDKKAVSTMSNLSTKTGQDFLYSWSACRQVPICGLDSTLGTAECRMPMPSGNSAYLPTRYTCPPAWQQP